MARDNMNKKGEAKKGNGGYIWSMALKLGVSAFWALVLLLIEVSPALAVGVGYVEGK